MKQICDKEIYKPSLRVIEINKSENNEYYATIQMVNKSVLFDIKPEELLSNNAMVNQFSPIDIRTLTYLGYLGINGPKYTILAKHLSEENNKIVFSIHKKGQKKVILKSALEIMRENEIISGLSSRESNIIGYTAASENAAEDEEIKKELLKRKILK